MRSFKSRSIAASIAAFGLILGLGVSGASANPAPDSGPTTGGTTVTLPAPEFKFTSVAADWAVSTASGSNGQVFAWGDNQFGDLGDGTTDARNVPGPVTNPNGVTLSGAHNQIALGSDGRTYVWGGNSGPSFTTSPSPLAQGEVPTGVHFVQVVAAAGTGAGLGSDGLVYVWNEVDPRPLGNGSATGSSTPVRALTPAGVKFTQISVGYVSILALGDDGKVYAWGDNQHGQLGDGTTGYAPLPVQVQQGAIPSGVKPVQVSMGEYFALILGDDGKVYSWGANANGQLGDGTTISRLTPGPIAQGAIPSGVRIVKVSAGGYFAVAIGDDGKAYSWGGDDYLPQLGNGTTNSSAVPVQVWAGEIPSGVRLIDVATTVGPETRHALVIGSNGRAYGWGSGLAGQLGNGENANQSAPVAVLMPQVRVTGVTFDGLAGTNLSAIDANNKFTVVTPERHPGGKVDVVVSWTLGGVPQSPITYRLGYEYLASISITDPVDQSVAEGGTATFSVASTSTPTPGTVIWQVSTDNGATWQPISADALASVSEGGHKLTVANAPLSHSGRMYRAQVSSLDGQATSAPAKLTVTKQVDPLPPTITDPGQGPVAGPVAPNKIPKKLPSTGGFSVWYLVAGAALLVTGAGLTITSRTRRKDAN